MDSTDPSTALGRADLAMRNCAGIESHRLIPLGRIQRRLIGVFFFTTSSTPMYNPSRGSTLANNTPLIRGKEPLIFLTLL